MKRKERTEGREENNERKETKKGGRIGNVMKERKIRRREGGVGWKERKAIKMKGKEMKY